MSGFDLRVNAGEDIADLHDEWKKEDAMSADKITPEWCRRTIAEDPDDPDGCAHCGAIAGCCSDYPNCPGGAQPRSEAMTTTVKILIEGNKACEVKVESDGAEPGQISTVKPGQFTTKLIHGDQRVSVVEVGPFLTE